MLLRELRDDGVGVFDDVSVAAVWRRPAAVARERLRAAVEDDLAAHRIAHDRADDRGGAVVERAKAATHRVHVVEHGGARTDLRHLRHEMRLVRRRSRSSRHDIAAQAEPVEAIDRLLELRGDDPQRHRLFPRLCPDVAWVAEDAVKPQASRRNDRLRQCLECIGGRHARPAHTHVQIHQHADRDSFRPCRRFHGLDRGDRVQRHPYGRGSGEPGKPLSARRVDHGIGHEEIRLAALERRQKRLRLAELRDRQASGPRHELLTGNVDALVGLRMRADGDAVCSRVARQTLDVAANANRTHHDRGRGHGVGAS